jgi:hypothetical protein
LLLQHFSENEKILIATRRAVMTSQEAITTLVDPLELPEEAEDGFLVLSEEELLALIDTGAREGLGMSGEEYLRRLRERTIERTGPNGYLAYLSMMASLLGY